MLDASDPRTLNLWLVLAKDGETIEEFVLRMRLIPPESIRQVADELGLEEPGWGADLIDFAERRRRAQYAELLAKQRRVQVSPPSPSASQEPERGIL